MSNKLLSATFAIALLAGCNNGEEIVVADSEKELDHLIFKEICHLGSWKTEWNSAYGYDPYIVIENPTDKTLYLDGMGLACSGLACNVVRNLREGTDHRDGFFGAYILTRFPGNGTDHPIAPHSFVTITGYAVDHTKDRGEEGYSNANSFDLSNANFEWFTPEQIEDEGDFDDNKNVPNMRVVYPVKQETVFKFIPQHAALALIQIPVNEDSLLKSKEYYWNTFWTTEEKIGHGGVIGESGGHAHDSGYNPVEFLKIPNKWVVDCVQICPQQDYQWNVVAADLDKGSASVMTTYRDRITNPTSVYGYSIFRKHDGNKYVDTNNSNFDFEKKPASLQKKNTAAQ